MADATRWFEHKKDFHMKRGGILPAYTLAWECWGNLNSKRSNAILIFTGLSPDAHAASAPENPEPGWWEPMVGAGKPIDSDRYFVICVNSLGSCKGSTGPASINPASGELWRLNFPDLSIEDIAASTMPLLADLGITRLQALVGPSMGGMTALSFLRQFPDSVNHMLNISSASAAEPDAGAVRS